MESGALYQRGEVSPGQSFTPTRVSQVVRYFAPSWFAAVMGTGVLTLGTAFLSRYYLPLGMIATVLHWFNVVLFLTLLVPWTLRWFIAGPQATAAMGHPVIGSFVPTVAIALLVLATQFIQVVQVPALAILLWWCGVAMAFGFSFLILIWQFTGDQVQLDHVTPGMFIPPVGLVVIPVAGAPLAASADAVVQGSMLLVCYVGLGSGILLWLSLQAITLFRLVLHKPITGQMAPTFWINLGPLGVIPISLVAIAEASPFIADKTPFLIAALLVWGFGIWWLVMAAMLTVLYWRRGELPFSLSWWAFTFPTGAFALASFRLSQLLPLPGIFAVGAVAFLLLVLFWMATLMRSLKGALDGSLFQPH